jgi:hypothetical protein
MRESRLARTAVIGLCIGLICAGTGAHSWDPPLLGFVIILAACLAGTSLVVGAYALGGRRRPH